MDPALILQCLSQAAATASMVLLREGRVLRDGNPHHKKKNPLKTVDVIAFKLNIFRFFVCNADHLMAYPVDHVAISECRAHMR